MQYAELWSTNHNCLVNESLYICQCLFCTLATHINIGFKFHFFAQNAIGALQVVTFRFHAFFLLLPFCFVVAYGLNFINCSCRNQVTQGYYNLSFININNFANAACIFKTNFIARIKPYFFGFYAFLCLFSWFGFFFLFLWFLFLATLELFYLFSYFLFFLGINLLNFFFFFWQIFANCLCTLFFGLSFANFANCIFDGAVCIINYSLCFFFSFWYNFFSQLACIVQFIFIFIT